MTKESITELLKLVQEGDSKSREDLFTILVKELRTLAESKMKSERPDHTLGASGLINETCMRLIDQNSLEASTNRRHLFACANRAMRQVLVDHVRTRNADKRFGKLNRSPLDQVIDIFSSTNGVAFEELNDALDQLDLESPRQREIVEHRFFSGLSIEETALLLAVSSATVERDWRLAKIKLLALLKS